MFSEIQPLLLSTTTTTTSAGIGTHYVDIWVGCPPQRQTVIVDTGSGDTAFPCLGCEDCGGYFNDVKYTDSPSFDDDDDTHYHIDSLYRQNESSCFQAVTCRDCQLGECYTVQEYQDYSSRMPPQLIGIPEDQTEICHVSMAYAEGSAWFAVESLDRAYAGGSHYEVDRREAEAASFDLRFGCQTKLTGLFRTQLADGIVGMMKVDSAYWEQLRKAGIIQRRQFSLCYTRSPFHVRRGTSAGGMVLGGRGDERLHSTPMVYLSSQGKRRSEMFTVVVEGMYLRSGNAGESIVVPPNVKEEDVVWKPISSDSSDFSSSSGTIVDSGTTSSYFARSLSGPFNKAFQELSGIKYGPKEEYRFSREELLALPTVVIKLKAWVDEDGNVTDDSTTRINGETFQGSVFATFPPSHYMKYYRSKDIYKAKLFFSRSSGFAPPTLGANFMMGKDLFFDVENDRIGIAESDCDYLSLGYKAFNLTADTGTSESEKPKPADQQGTDSLTAPSPGPNKTDDGDQQTGVCHSLSCRLSSPLVWIIGLVVTFLLCRRYCGKSSNSSAYGTARIPSNDDELYEDGFHDGTNGFHDDAGDNDDKLNGFHDVDDDENGTEMVETTRNNGELS